MAEKHYHNDYKRLIGLDESRTASEKLLDKAIGKKQQTRQPIIEPINEPTKRVKREAEQGEKITADDALTKITKTLSSRNNIIKMQKSLQVLRKCLNQGEFANSLKLQRLVETIQCLTDNNNFPSASLGECTKLAQVQLVVLDALNVLSNLRCQQKTAISDKVGLEVMLLKLITDDSFNFTKDLANLKSYINKLYDSFTLQKDTQQNKQLKNQQKINEYIENYLLRKLTCLPNLHLEWAHTAITNFLKQFIIQYKSHLKKQKQFLEQYNKLIQNKKVGVDRQTSDIMGNKRVMSGGTYTVLEKQDSTNAWCKRQ